MLYVALLGLASVGSALLGFAFHNHANTGRFIDVIVLRVYRDTRNVSGNTTFLIWDQLGGQRFRFGNLCARKCLGNRVRQTTMATVSRETVSQKQLKTQLNLNGSSRRL